VFDADKLSLKELRLLRQQNPQRLFKHLTESEREFVFGVEDHREEKEEWGGEFRVLLNRNIELHFVPAFNAAMENDDELPQFCVRPDGERAGTVAKREIDIGEEDGETVPGVTFYVEPERYDTLREELSEVVDRYDDWDIIPDTWFLETELVSFLTTSVLEDETIAAERKYDFRRGLVGGTPPIDEVDIDHQDPPVE
jgi:hypothetical protein